MDDIEYRKEVHRRLMILKEKLEAGEVKFAPHLIEGFKESFEKVRYAADGLVDLDTVDSRVRSAAMMLAHFKDRDDWKNAISLMQIQASYFELVEQAFGDLHRKLYSEAISRVPETSPTQFSHWVTSYEEHVTEYIGLVEDFIESIRKFWDNANTPTWIHLEDQTTLKAVFGGETFPINSSNVAGICGLYVDTICLPCPFSKILPMFDHAWDQHDKVQNILAAALSLLQYQEVVLADLDAPIVVILPDRFPYDEEYREFIVGLGEHDALLHAGALFGREFESIEEVNQFCRAFTTFDDLISHLKSPERLLFDTDWLDLSIPEQIDKFLNSEVKPLSLTPKNLVYAQSFMRMNQANDLLQRSRQINGTPLIQAPTSWRYFNWKLEYDSHEFNQEGLTHLHMVRGLQATAEAEMQWLGNIPTDSLLEMRKSGASEEIRKILSQGVHEIANARPTNFYRTGDQIVENIQRAFEVHQAEVNKLSAKKWKFAGRDIGSFLVSGTLEIGMALTGNPLFGTVIYGANQVFDIPKLKDFPNIARELAGETRELKKSPAGLFFKHKK